MTAEAIASGVIVGVLVGFALFELRQRRRAEQAALEAFTTQRAGNEQRRSAA